MVSLHTYLIMLRHVSSFPGHYAGRSQFLEYNALPTAILCAAFIADTPALWKLGIVAVVALLALTQNVRSWREYEFTVAPTISPF